MMKLSGVLFVTVVLLCLSTGNTQTLEKLTRRVDSSIKNLVSKLFKDLKSDSGLQRSLHYLLSPKWKAYVTDLKSESVFRELHGRLMEYETTYNYLVEQILKLPALKRFIKPQKFVPPSFAFFFENSEVMSSMRQMRNLIKKMRKMTMYEQEPRGAQRIRILFGKLLKLPVISNMKKKLLDMGMEINFALSILSKQIYYQVMAAEGLSYIEQT